MWIKCLITGKKVAEQGSDLHPFVYCDACVIKPMVEPPPIKKLRCQYTGEIVYED
jgi:hypothetical protein